MKPIKKGMTKAVTRDGRKVTQLTWFECIGGTFSVVGVIDGLLNIWTSNGRFLDENHKHKKDIFAPVEYEWQWLYRTDAGNGDYNVTRHMTEQELNESYVVDSTFSRIEESKREVK